MTPIVIKLGSSVVVDREGQLREQTLTEICQLVADLHTSGESVLVVTSGAIARGIQRMGLPSKPTEMAQLQAASAVGQGLLYRCYEERLAGLNVPAAQVLLTFFDVSARSHYLNVRTTLNQLFEWRVVPIINENDTTTTDEISFGDNDFLAAQIALVVGAKRLVLLTDIDGLYSADPRKDPQAQLIGRVDDPEDLAGFDISHSTSPMGSGGMRSKVVAAEMAVAGGIPTTICNGLNTAAIASAVEGSEQVGTFFPAGVARYSSFKLWLKYAKPQRGVLRVDAGAASALVDSGTSLLPVGIVDVSGEFDSGDAVAVVNRDGSPIGKGIASLSSVEIDLVKGLKSVEVQELIPDAVEEIIHRDYFVLD